MSQDIADAVAQEYREHGEAMTLRRPGSPNVDVVVYGKRYQPQGGPLGGEIAGSAAVRQATLYVKISNAEIAAAAWPGPPRNSDRLIIGTRHYILQGDADTRKDGETVLAHFMVVRGGPA